MSDFSIRGAFRRKGTSDAFIPVYYGSQYDKMNICNDLRNVGSAMRNAMDAAKVEWSGKKG